MMVEYHEPVNLGNPNEFKINELVNLIQSMIESGSVTYVNLPSDDPRNRKPDITVASKILNWNPSLELKEGISLVVKKINNV